MRYKVNVIGGVAKSLQGWELRPQKLMRSAQTRCVGIYAWMKDERSARKETRCHEGINQ
jgi:hypothetical protein